MFSILYKLHTISLLLRKYENKLNNLLNISEITKTAKQLQSEPPKIVVVHKKVQCDETLLVTIL